jgi:SAM-dependent methyltransferase
MTPEGSQQLLYHLRRLIRRDDCVLSYDFDLVGTLPDILREQYAIGSESDVERNADLKAVYALLKAGNVDVAPTLSTLPILIRSTGVVLDEFIARAPEGITGQNAGMFEKWSTASANESVGEAIELQKDLGMGRYNTSMQRYGAERGNIDLKTYLRSVTTAPPSLMERIVGKHFWELKFARWLRAGKIKPERRSLSIGPRWLTEVEYFRQVVGLPRHIGLDLFSDDPEMVVAGDMHAMPFPDHHFNFIFLKNTADKSYRIRRLVEELLRVTEPGGLIVIDQICGYGRCSPLSRTDIQRAANLLRLFRARAQVTPLVCRDVDVSGLGDARENNETRRNARLAIQVAHSH